MLETADAVKQRDRQLAEALLDEALASFPDHPALLNASAASLLQYGEFKKARNILTSLLESSKGAYPAFQALLKNNIAWADALSGDVELLEEADVYSAEALAKSPSTAYILGTRGTVLVELGKIAAGLALLKRAFAFHAQKQSKALAVCYIAIGEHRLGNVTAGRRYLAIAQMLDPDCMLIERAAGEMTRNAAV